MHYFGSAAAGDVQSNQWLNEHSKKYDICLQNIVEWKYKGTENVNVQLK